MHFLTATPNFKTIPPNSLAEFKQVDPTDVINLPEVSQNRRLTNVPCLLLLVIALIAWVTFSVYIIINSDVNITLNVRDSCGFLCGADNIYPKNETCKPKDYTNYPVLLLKEEVVKNTSYKLVPSECITKANCTALGQDVIFGRCFPTLDAEDLNYFNLETQKLIYMLLEGASSGSLSIFIMVLIAIAASLCLYLFFRCSAKITVIIFLGLILCLIISALFGCWALYLTKKNSYTLVAAILSTITTVATFVLLVWMRRRVKLMIRMFEEATDAIFSISALLVFPLVVFVFMFVVNAFGAYMIILTLSHPELLSPNQWLISVCYSCLLGFMVLWIYALCNGCQCMIVSGAVATYYFTRDKSTLDRPFLTSLIITFRYHLGTIAAGSLIITLITIVRLLISRFRSSSNKGVFWLNLVIRFIKSVEEFAHYLTKKAYIMTALHGKSLLPSGKRAVRLMWKFLLDTIVIDTLGYLIMHVAAFLITAATMTIGISLVKALGGKYIFIHLSLGVYFAGTIAFFYISVMNVAVETLYLCFCEDKLMNDGSMLQPYFMSARLLKLVNSALELSNKGDEEEP